MEDEERQKLLDQIASQAAEIAQLKQTIDTLVRRIFGAKSEALGSRRSPRRAGRLASHRSRTLRAAPLSARLLRPHPHRPSQIRQDRRPADKARLRSAATQPPGRCIATPSLVTEVLDNRFTCHLPYYRQAEIFARLGVNLHRKTLCDWTLLASDWLSAIYREIQYEHWRVRYRQLNETPINYRESGSGRTKTGYLWVSNIPGGRVIYHWRKGRDQGSSTYTGDTARVIQCEGFSAYPSWAKGKACITLMGCHAHVRRKFFEAKDQSPRLFAWILRQLSHLYQIESRLRETHAGPALPSLVPGTGSSSESNTPEKSPRSFTPLSKNCRRHGINPRDYLEDALTRLPAMKARSRQPHPANWLKARSGKTVRTAA